MAESDVDDDRMMMVKLLCLGTRLTLDLENFSSTWYDEKQDEKMSNCTELDE